MPTLVLAQLPKFEQPFERIVSRLNERAQIAVKYSLILGYSASSIADMFPEYFATPQSAAAVLRTANAQIKAMTAE